MEPQFHLGDELNELERALTELAPIPARFDVAQTMFRAGQASVRRSNGWQRIWPATSVLLAVVSLTLGTLLAIPDEPQIVYIPVDATVDGERIPQPALVAENRNAATDNTWPALSTTYPVEIAHPDVRWLTPISHLRSRDLAMGNPWDTMPIASRVSQPVAIPALCSGDWRTMVGEEGSSQLPRESNSSLPLGWKHLLHTRGS